MNAIDTKAIDTFQIDSSQKQMNAGAVWLLLSAVFAAGFLLPFPSSTGRIAGLPSVCLFYHLTGLPCPGCGLTRSFVCLSHGQWAEALHWHPLGPAIYFVFLLLWLRCGLYRLRGVTLLPLAPPAAGRLSIAACVIVLVAGIARIGWLTMHHLRF